MRKNLKKSFFIGLIAGSILSLCFVGYIYVVSKQSLAISDEISKIQTFSDLGITVKTLEGEKVDMNSFNDKSQLVNFWGTWCAPCIKEFPILQEVYNEINDEFVFIMISDEPNEKIKAFQEKNGYNFIFLKSDEKLKSKIGAFPTTFIINQKNEITFSQLGAFTDVDKEELKTLFLEKSR